MSTRGSELASVVMANGSYIGAATAVVIADAILAAGYSKPHTISSVEELDALPEGSVVTNVFGDASTIWDDVRDRNPKAYRHLVQHGPATVLYTPKES